MNPQLRQTMRLRRYIFQITAFVVLAGGFLFLSESISRAQSASVTETEQQIRTYPFGDPNPVPTLVTQPEIYPYFRFDGFSHEAEQERWTVVTLENPYIKVQVLPGVGGKVYGAIEKSTGREFVYRNEVLKFRDIAMRGPWTSGGIEFNFGAIGHAPTTATPVDYELRTNPDGSVSCIVGAPDLPSRTRWQVEIRLPADKAYFETRIRWFNTSDVHQSNYQWLTSAQLARDDLEFFFPGTHYIGHGGDLHPWPVDEEGRRISLYRNNDFGGSKSYHILGTYSDFYGGYWHDDDFGYGRWGMYEDYPGQKLWIWALSRQGGIWEDLLTDTSGQYVESQSGRFFNQATLSSGLDSPFTQQYIPPRHTEAGRSIWFPVQEIGGMVEASPYGVLNVDRRGEEAWVGLYALQPMDDHLRVFSGDSLLYTTRIDLSPTDVYETALTVPSALRDDDLRVTLGKEKLSYRSDPERNRLQRPLQSEHAYDESRAEGRFRIAEEQAKYRNYAEALDNYIAVLEEEPLHLEAAVRAAELYYRGGEYEKGLDFARRALKISAYHPGANYYYGLLHDAQGNMVDAREAFGWAVRDPAYRAAGNVSLARLSAQQNEWEEVVSQAERALESDAENISALRLIALAARKQEADDRALAVLDSIEAVDVLGHFAAFERYLLDPSDQRLKEFRQQIRHELPYQTHLELGIWYANLNQIDDAVRMLKAAPRHPVVLYWLSYLLRKENPEESRQYLTQAEALEPDFAFPYRRETLPVIDWVAGQSSSWKTGYYLGLVSWANGQRGRAWELWNALDEVPDFAPFYLTRGLLAQTLKFGDPERDFERALELAPDEWRGWHRRIDYALQQGNGEEMVARGQQAYERFPDNYIIGMDYARVLLAASEYEAGLEVLNEIRVLPYEGAGEGRNLWVRANLHRGLALLAENREARALEYFREANRWPEHLGVGRPYHPDTRMIDYLIAETLRRSGQPERAEEKLREVIDYTDSHSRRPEAADYFAMLAYRELDMPDQAEELFSRWSAEREEGSPVLQWVRARLDGRKQEAANILSELETETAAESDPWVDQIGNSNFQLVVEVMKRLDSSDS